MYIFMGNVSGMFAVNLHLQMLLERLFLSQPLLCD